MKQTLKEIPNAERLLITRKTSRGEERSIIVTPDSKDGFARLLTARNVLPSSIVRVEGLDRMASPEQEESYRKGLLTPEQIDKLRRWPALVHTSLHVRPNPSSTLH